MLNLDYLLFGIETFKRKIAICRTTFVNQNKEGIELVRNYSDFRPPIAHMLLRTTLSLLLKVLTVQLYF